MVNRVFVFVLLALLPLAAPAAIRLTDDTGRIIVLAAPATRIVSLAPDLTELAYDAGAGQDVVGTVSYSDYPPAARKLPRIGDAFSVDLERLVALQPDLILAWRGGTPVSLIGRLRALHLPVVVLGTHALTDIARNLELIGQATGHEVMARTAARAFLTGLGKLRKQYAGRVPVSVFYEISATPLFTVGGQQSISRLIALCGGKNIFAELTQLAAPVSLAAVVARDPQVIFTGDDGDARSRLAAWQQFREMTAVRHGHLFIVSSDLTARATPRILEGGAEICRDLDSVRTGTGEH